MESDTDIKEKNKQFWETRVYALEDGYLFSLMKKLNEFYKDKWVIATQIFNSKEKWQAVIYFKIKIGDENEIKS